MAFPYGFDVGPIRRITVRLRFLNIFFRAFFHSALDGPKRGQEKMHSISPCPQVEVLMNSTALSHCKLQKTHEDGKRAACACPLLPIIPVFACCFTNSPSSGFMPSFGCMFGLPRLSALLKILCHRTFLLRSTLVAPKDCAYNFDLLTFHNVGFFTFVTG